MNLKNAGILLCVLILTFTLDACGKKHADQSSLVDNKPVHVKVTKTENKTTNEKEKDEKIREAIKNYLTESNLSGTVAVVQGKHIIFNEGAGYADREKQILNQASTTYPIGSITKTFVASSIMLLQEQGKLNIQDPVSKYIPGFPNGNNIKLYHFLTHTSGIERLHWHPGDTTPQRLVQEIEKAPVKFQPGAQWDYLDANYMVLGYIVEKTTGIKLEDFIRVNILDKVPMRETGFITHEHPVPYSSVGYLLNAEKVEPTKYLSAYPLFGCGNIYMTAYDLSQYDQALMSGRIISQASLKQVLTPSGKSVYGLGLYNKGNIIYSIGVLGGWYSMHAYYPEDKTSIVVLLNARSKTTNIEPIVDRIYQIVKGNNQLLVKK